MNDQLPPMLQNGSKRARLEEVFEPMQQNRQGELFAWLSAAGILAAMVILRLRSDSIPFWIYGLFGFFTLAALAISFSHYMDGHTQIRISGQGLWYLSPVRKVHLTWDQVRRLSAAPTGRGWRVRVEGETGYFQFRSPYKVKVGNRGEIDLGIKEGDRLVSLIRGSAGLDRVEKTGGVWVAGPSNGE